MGVQTSNKVRPLMVIKLGGTFCAFMIGAGYATGQEALQYFTVYGFLGTLLGVLLGIVLFSWLSAEIMSVGYEANDTEGKNAYCILLGNVGGKVISFFLPVFMFLTYVVMISGAGATFKQQFDVAPVIGSAILAVVTVCVVLLGLSKVIDTIGLLGPAIALVALCIGVFILIKNGYDIAAANAFITEHIGEMYKSAANWFISSFLYVLYGIVMAVPFMSAVGSKANNMKEIISGAILGSTLFGAALLALSLAIASKIDVVYSLQIPALAMANSIHPVLGCVYSVILVLAIFTTSVPLLWTVAARIAPEKTKLFYVAVAAIAAFGLLGGQLPFGKLVNVIYPLIGWLGFIFIFAIIWREYKRVKSMKNKDEYLTINEKAALAKAQDTE